MVREWVILLFLATPAVQCVNASDVGSCTKGKFSEIVRVFHILDKSAPHGISEMNAGNPRGDMGFIFGTDSDTRARGCKAYFDNGKIELIYVSVKKWGVYQLCNHAPGSMTYHCQFDPHKPKPSADPSLPGKEKDAHTGGWWYSFPAKGLGKSWNDESDFHQSPSPECSGHYISAGAMIKYIGATAGCHNCDSASKCVDCGACIRKKMSVDKMVDTWNAVFGIGESYISSFLANASLVV